MLWLLACTSPVPVPASEPWWEPPATEATAATDGDRPDLVLNEVQTDNESTVMTPAGGFADWVELLNRGEEPIDLERVTLRDEAGDDASVGSGSLGPGEHLLLWADGQDDPGHLPFALDADGTTLELRVDGERVDRLVTGPLEGDTVWGRYPNGGSWAPSARPTPGSTNGNAPGVSLDPSDHLFGTARIHRVDLTIPEASWAGLEASAYDEQPGSLGFEGAWFDPVSVRIKGQLGSLRNLDQKAAFKVDLDDYERHRLRGQETLTLNNMVQDPSFVHEYLTYTLYRALDLPAPRVGWTELYVNEELWGLYLLLETADDPFLARWFQDPGGHLFEAAYGVDLYVGHEDSFEYDEGPDETDRSDLTELAEVLDGTWDEAAMALVEGHVDMDRFVRLMAVEAVTLHWDGYTSANNYRLYHDPQSDLFTFLPWGCDQTWVDYWYMPYSGYGRLFQFCMAVESCRARYSADLVHVADTVEALNLVDELDHLSEWLAEAIEADPRKEVSLGQVSDELEVTRQTLLDWPAEVRARAEVE